LKVTEDSLKRLIPIPATTTTLYDPYIILQTDFFSLFCACLSLLTFETKLNKKKTKQKICKEKETMLKKNKNQIQNKRNWHARLLDCRKDHWTTFSGAKLIKCL